MKILGVFCARHASGSTLFEHISLEKYRRPFFAAALLLGVLGLPVLAAAAPVVDGHFIGPGGDMGDYTFLGESPDGKGAVYYAVDSGKLFVAIKTSTGFVDNLFATKTDTDERQYQKDVGWDGGNHDFKKLEVSDHVEVSLNCNDGLGNGENWLWRQDTVYRVLPHTGNPATETWLSDVDGPDGTGGVAGTDYPASLVSASSLQWNLLNSSWDITQGGTRTDYESWISPHVSLVAPEHPDLGGDGYDDTNDWEWPVTYEFSIDVADCPGDPTQTINIAVTGAHASNSKDGEETVIIDCEGGGCDVPGTLVVIKDVGANDDSSFSFASTSVGGFSITTSGGSGRESFAVPSGSVNDVTEVGPPAGWDLGSASCVEAGGDSRGSFNATTNTVSGVTVNALETVTCTFVNEVVETSEQSLTLVKVVSNNWGGAAQPDDFDLEIETVGDVTSGLSETLSAGTYEISELLESGYEYTSLDCGSCGDHSTCPANLTVDSGRMVGDVILASGENVVCTITNSDLPPTLTLVKQVINDDGGTAEATQWILTAQDGNSSFSGAGTGNASEAINGPHNVHAGVPYFLSESGGPGGYSTGGFSCTGGGTFDSEVESIVLDLDEDAVCTIVNDDVENGRIEIALQLIPALGDIFNFAGATPISLGHGGIFGKDVRPGSFETRTPWSAINLRGWFVDSFTCNDVDSVIDLAGAQDLIATYHVDPSETVRCTLVLVRVYEEIPVAVPANNAWFLLLLASMMLGTGWYFRPSEMCGS